MLCYHVQHLRGFLDLLDCRWGNPENPSSEVNELMGTSWGSIGMNAGLLSIGTKAL